jgi:hypothetical protein
MQNTGGHNFRALPKRNQEWGWDQGYMWRVGTKGRGAASLSEMGTKEEGKYSHTDAQKWTS